MIKYVFAITLSTSRTFSETFKESYKNLKPTPKKVPVIFEAVGLRESITIIGCATILENPEVINHLNSENDYLDIVS